jgi:cell division protein ZapE
MADDLDDPELELAAATTVAGAYDAHVALGEFAYDPAQHAIAQRLDRLLEELTAPKVEVKSSALGWLFGRKHEAKPLRGLYVHGAVGRGKTMLMDLFHERAPVVHKRRVHFHAFMSETQDRIHKVRQEILAGTRKGDDPIRPVADIIADEARLLSFDEFNVTDIADAMILGRLFTRLFERGTVVVATSNVKPSQLYKGGLNRQLFLPFIDLLRQHLDVMELEAATDYRRTKTDLDETWLHPLGPETDAHLERLWDQLRDGAEPHPAKVPFRGRQIAVPRAVPGVARFHFSDLCEKPLAAADYLALAGVYHTFVIEGVPELGDNRRNEARRFIHLIDALYDRRKRLVATAAAEPERIYRSSEGNEGFEFARTASRLAEMRSSEYLAAQQDPLSP